MWLLMQDGRAYRRDRVDGLRVVPKVEKTEVDATPEPAAKKKASKKKATKKVTKKKTATVTEFVVQALMGGVWTELRQFKQEVHAWSYVNWFVQTSESQAHYLRDQYDVPD